MWQQAIFFTNSTHWYTNVLQHITALQRALGHRVLRKNSPDGWGRKDTGSLDED
jgi:hypothetical protein